MKETTLKLIIDIESKSIGRINGTFSVTEMLFSKYSGLIDADEMIKDVKQCIKMVKGFRMLTIRLTEGETYETFPTEINSVRFVNDYGEIKMAFATKTSGYNCYAVWEIVKEKFIYDNIKAFVKDANLRQLRKVSEANDTPIPSAN